MLQFQALQQQMKVFALPFVLSLLVVSNNNVAFGQLNDFTCNVWDDFVPNPKCPTLGNGICEDPKYNDANANVDCREQDCVDCNPVTCSVFDGDCFNCLNAKGCYYCPGDGTCDNSPFYSDRRKIKVKSCKYTDFQIDFLSFNEGDTDDQCVSDDAYYKDPSYGGSQWMFEMINVIDVWKEYGLTGEGVTIRINDDGVYTDNLEFKNRFDKEENSCSSYLPNADEIDDNGHGTKVAGIILANADNDLCSVGIANKAKFSSCNFFDNTSYTSLSDLTHKLETFDISQNSIGMPACEEDKNTIDLIQDENIIYDEGCPFIYNISDYYPCDSCEGEFTATDRSLSTSCSNAISKHCKYYYREDHDACLDFPALVIKGACDYDRTPQIATTAFEKGVTEGRDGKGTIFTFASGNSFGLGDDVNFSGWTNTRYTISVGSVGKNGKHAGNSTAGAALLVTAPAGNELDFGYLMTAGLGVETCANSGPGTSFACPVVSGVIALMLEANPELSWRDVQGILAATSQNVDDDNEDDTITVNGKNYWHSNWYGFGIIDAKAAVEAAMDWELYTEELQVVGISPEENAIIEDTNKNKFISKIWLDPLDDNYADNFVTESTVVLLNLSHYNRGDLEIELVSPSGTTSILHPGKRPESNQLTGDERWKLMTVKNWGESPTGKWKLKIRDLVNRDQAIDSNVFRDWKLVVYGRAQSDNSGKSVTPTDTPSEAPSLIPRTPSEAPSLSKDVRPVDESNQSQWCLDPFSVNNSCGELANGLTKCPARTVMIFDNSESERYDDRYTVDADVYCPTDLLEEEGIDVSEATRRRGFCTCEAGLYNLNCNQIEEDLECECFECPRGSVLRVGYQCNKEIANGCSSFNCDGSCTDFFKSTTATPSDTPSNAPSLISSTPSEAPSSISVTPSVSPTKSSTKSSKTTKKMKSSKNSNSDVPSSISSTPTESPTASPTKSSTKSSKAPKKMKSAKTSNRN